MRDYLKQIHSIRDIVPVLMVALTGVERYLPDNIEFNWRGNVVHSLWMCYDLIFWKRMEVRRVGITYASDSTGERQVYVHSFIGLLLFIEHEVIRPLFRWELKWEKVYLPQLSFAGMPQAEPIGIPYLFAIALDTTGTREATSSTPTIQSVTHAGSDRLSTTNLNWGNSRTLSGAPTFGGSGFTQISSTVDTSDGNPYIAGHRLVAPSTSTGDLTATLSGSSFYRFLMASYTGVNQSTPTANETNNTGSVSPASPVDYSRTSTANGSYMWLIAKSDSGADQVAITAGGIRRCQLGSPAINGMFDSNAGINNGNSNTMTITHAGGGQRLGVVYCMLVAIVASGPANLKSRSGNVLANIKSISGNLIGNVKSLSGNS